MHTTYPTLRFYSTFRPIILDPEVIGDCPNPTGQGEQGYICILWGL